MRQSGKIVEIDYTNYEGKRALRRILPIEIVFDQNPYHPGLQWFVRALDVERNVERCFALKDIHSWVKATEVVSS